MINSLLRQLGFGEKEVSVYLAVLENGKITPSQVAEITKIKRTTVYAVAKELIRKGVITEDQSVATSYLLALPPTDLSNSLQKEEAELEAKKKIVRETVQSLKKIVKNTKYSIPKLVFISEGEVEQYLYKQSSVWAESTNQRDGTWWGFQDPTFVDKYRSWIDWFWKKGNQKDIAVKLLTNQSDIEKELNTNKYSKRNVKFWENAKGFTSSIWINGNYIVMINTSQRPHYLVEIHDASMAHNLRELFKALWLTS